MVLILVLVIVAGFVGRRPGDERLADGEQESGRRRRRRLETQRAPHHNQSQAAGDSQNRLLADAQAHETH